VAWRVLSADSHPVRGAFVFSIGEPAGDVSDVVEQVLNAEAGSSSVDWALTVTRFVGLALILLCVGGVALLAFVVPAGEERARPLWAVLAVAGVLLAVDSLAWIALTGVQAAAFGLDAVFRWSLARDVLATGFSRCGAAPRR
jgi:copper transport protein